MATKRKAPGPKCKHCRKARAVARGLCAEHYLDPAVRDLYPAEAVAEVKVEERKMPAKDSQSPTTAQPGTNEKVAVLKGRYRSGKKMWVEGDAERDDEKFRRRSFLKPGEEL